MKYANIIHQGLGKTGKRKVVNLGDYFEALAIENLYIMNGIPASDIVTLDLYEIESYRGEQLLLPINFMFMSNISGVNLFNISKDIKPVFLGLSILNDDIEDWQVDCLKKFEPIGCRDELSKNILIKKGVSAYQGGCIVATTKSHKSRNNRKQIIFIDVPLDVEKYVPNEIKEKRIFMNHEFYVDTEQGFSIERIKSFARQRIEHYDENAALIVTSRFHAAVIAIALQIPVIVVVENNFYKFSWISKVAPFYEREQFPDIDWNPSPVCFDQEKKWMEKIVCRRVFDQTVPKDTITHLDEALHNSSRSDTRALHYTSGAIEHINFYWSKEEKIKFGVWGINDNATIICDYIRRYYKNATLVTVYDGLRKTEFMGMETVTPSPDNIADDVFVFVTSNTARKPAMELFQSLGKSNYYICKLGFISGDVKTYEIGQGELG